MYIATNATNRVLYTGVTNDLLRRMFQHRTKANPDSFTAHYKINKLVYFAMTTDVHPALHWEKQIKAGSRAGKIQLIEEMNPGWEDLTDSLF